MIPGFDLSLFAQSAGPIAAILVVAGIIFAESGLLIGFFLPGDSLLFTLGFLIQGTSNFRLDINIHLAVLVLFMAAALGDNVGYTFGRRVGHKLFKRPDSLLFRQENIQHAQDFYEKHGVKTIIIARFVPIVRTFAPLVAGIGKMHYKTFLIFNLVGAFLWAAGVTYAGYFAGGLLTKMGIDIDTILLPIVAIILFVSIAPAAYHLLKKKEQRQAIWNTIQSEFKKITKKIKS